MNFLNIEGQGLALEAIDFQTPEFAETIVGYIDKIFKCKNGKEADASDEANGHQRCGRQKPRPGCAGKTGHEPPRKKPSQNAQRW